MSNNIEKKRKFLQFQLSNRFSNTMPNALYQALNNPSRKTENCAYRINKYVSENQNFVSEFYNTMNSTHKKGLYLFDAPQGSGKTSFLMSWAFGPAGKMPEPTVIVEPKKSNINQLKATYPALAILTGDTQATVDGSKLYPVTQYTPLVVCTPELAAKAVYLLKKLFGYVANIVLDEAHDLISAIPSYRDSEKFYHMLNETLLNQSSNIICITATPEPLTFINFDKIFKLVSESQLGTDLFEIVDIRNEDSRHMSMAACYAATIKEQLAANQMPMLILLENKTSIEKIADILGKEGYQCLTVHSGNVKDTPVMNSIISSQTLPAIYEGRFVDVIFTTSTIISGVTINPNVQLGQAQFIPAAIIEDMYKTDLSALSQFFCRLRYNTPKTVLFKRGFKSMPKKALTLQQCYNTIYHQTSMLNSTSIFANSNCAGYNTEVISNINAIYDCDSQSYDMFAIFCNALAERDARLYGHNEAFLSELSNTYPLKKSNCISRNFLNRTQLGLACDAKSLEEAREIKATRKEQKTTIVKAALKAGSIEKIFSKEQKQTLTQEDKDFITVMKSEMKTLNLANQIGGIGKVKEVVEKMAEGGMSQKAVNKAEFDIFRATAMSACGRRPLLELARQDENYVKRLLKKYNFNVPEIMKTLKMIRTSKYYRHLDGFDLGLTASETYALLYYSRNEHQFYENIRKLNAEFTIDAYMDEKKTDEVAKDSIMGQELAVLLNVVLDEKKNIRYTPGTTLSQSDIKAIAKHLDENVPVYAVFNQGPTTASQVLMMLSDILNGHIENDSFVYTGGFAKFSLK